MTQQAEPGFQGRTVFISGAGSGFGLSLAWSFAGRGATVLLSARSLDAAQRACDRIRERCPGAQLYPFACDLTRPDDIRAAVEAVSAQFGTLDILVNNGSMWLPEGDFHGTSDDAIAAVIASGVTGPVLLTKHLLPLLERAPAADIVNVVSKAAEQGFLAGGPHEAFYAMKHGHAGFADILRARLKDRIIRVLSLYPPDFENTDPFGPDWGRVRDDEERRLLNAKNLIDTIHFALAQPRSCYISKIHFDGNHR